jgi:KaiC/GvpD/RAD55 family RecA-like ATPase
MGGKSVARTRTGTALRVYVPSSQEDIAMTKQSKPVRRALGIQPDKAGALRSLAKCPTGIRGLDDVTEGGLPRGRSTLVCGGAGCGKTLMAMEFIVRGARDFGEPGVFMAFEETEAELSRNVASLGFDLPSLTRRKKLAVDYVRIERGEIEVTGEYDLEGLFVRLGSMIDEVHAKRVVLDTIESLFASLPNDGILRAELRRLFRWLKDRGVTAVITAEQGQEGQLTRYGLEEYVSDCVIVLDHRVSNQVATRRLRVVKYRGSKHGTNEYPTMIDEHGLSILPIASLGLCYGVPVRRISTGIPRLAGQQHSGQRYRRRGQDQHRHGAREQRLQARRPVSLLRLRGVARADHAQHGVHRLRPETARAQRTIAVSFGPANALRTGEPPGHPPRPR